MASLFCRTIRPETREGLLTLRIQCKAGKSSIDQPNEKPFTSAANVNRTRKTAQHLPTERSVRSESSDIGRSEDKEREVGFSQVFGSVRVSVSDKMPILLWMALSTIIGSYRAVPRAQV